MGSNLRERRKAIRKARAAAHRANCERGHWKAAALLLGFSEGSDDITGWLVVYGHGVHFDDQACNPWKDAVEWWQEYHERCNCYDCALARGDQVVAV